MKQNWKKELKRIMGDKYYEGSGTDFVYTNIESFIEELLQSFAREMIENQPKEKRSVFNSQKYVIKKYGVKL
jgi:hypothetical protein